MSYQPEVDILDETQFLEQRLQYGRAQQQAMNDVGDYLDQQMNQLYSSQCTVLQSLQESSNEEIKPLCSLMMQQLAMLLNNKRTRYNRRLMENPMLHECQFMPLHKVHAGVGSPLANAEDLPNNDDMGELEVGALGPAELFPANIRELKTLSLDQINRLSMVMNETFGITAQDDEQQSRDKVVFYMSN